MSLQLHELSVHLGYPPSKLATLQRTSPSLSPHLRRSPPGTSGSSSSEAHFHPYRRHNSASMTSSPLPTSTAQQQLSKISGVPCSATPTRYTAPVHIDVGGTIYTSSLETLTK